ALTTWLTSLPRPLSWDWFYWGRERPFRGCANVAIRHWLEKFKRLDRRARLIGLGGLLAVLFLLGYLLRGGRSSGFSTVQVKRGDLVAAISATGTVEPEQVVDV